MSRNNRTWRYIYTPKKSKKRKTIRIILFLLSSPITLPLFLLTHIGYYSEIVFDKIDDILEVVAEFINFKILK